MADYFEKANYVLDRIWFDYLGGRYEGRGLLHWSPDDGFRIEALLDRRAPLPPRLELGRAGVLTKSDACDIRMRPRGFDWAIAPAAVLVGDLSLVHDKVLARPVRRIIFANSVPSAHAATSPRSRSLHKIRGSILLPDSLESETRIKGKRIWQRFSRQGLWWDEPENRRIVGRGIDDQHVQIYSEFHRSSFAKSNVWQWAKALQDALSLIMGETTALLEHEIRFRDRVYLERQKAGEVTELNTFLRPFDEPIVNKERLLAFADYFLKNDETASVCRKMFHQMAEAARQRTLQATELLLSTILEAALRTLDNHPFKPGDDSWEIRKSMNRFRRKYLSDEWVGACYGALEARKRLRHRNAHPDWLAAVGGSLSTEEEEALDDMVFMSRFYGHMMLALAGQRNLQPNFPAPHKMWGPAISLVTGDGNQDGSIADSQDRPGRARDDD